MNLRWYGRPGREQWPALCALLGVAFLLYAGSFSHPWLHDDQIVVVENPDIRSLKAFLDDHYPGRPLREVTYLLDYQLFGLNPAGWHVQNIFWHGLCGGLLFVLLRQLRASLLVAFGAALLFLVHPLQVEVVANIANRKDALALCASLVCLLAWVRARSQENWQWRWFLAAAGAFGLALTAKQHTMVVPLAILAWELLLTPEERRWRWLNWRLVAGIAGAGAAVAGGWLLLFGGGRWFVEKIPYKLATLNVDSGSFGDYFRAVFAGWGELFRRVLYPVGLAPEYVYPLPDSWFDLRVLLPLLLVTGLAAMVFLLRQREPLAAFGLAWLLLFWLPVSNLLPLAYFVADRYMYAPLAGAAIAVAVLVERLPGNGVRWTVLAATVCLLATFTWQQNQVWSSARALWSHAVAVSPLSVNAINNLGDALKREGDLDAAAIAFKQAIAINPAAPYPFYNLGVIYDRQGKRELALHHFQQFLLRADQSPVKDHHVTAAKLRDYLARKYGRDF